MTRGQDGKPQPQVGDVFAFRIGKKLHGFCWVARKTKPEYVYSSQLKKMLDVPNLAVACADWVGTKLPTPDDVASRRVLRVTFDGQKPQPCVRFDSCGPPRGFVKIGKISKPSAPHVRELYSGFKGVQYEATRQWQWDHQRGKLLADDRAAEREEAAEDRADAQALKAKLATRKKATLGGLARIELLPEWAGLVSARHRKSVEALLRDLIGRLRVARDRKAKLAAIEAIVLKINRWNDRSGVIETEEREALATVIDELGHKAGLRGHDLAGEFRDW